jgi:hypothetical protein
VRREHHGCQCRAARRYLASTRRCFNGCQSGELPIFIACREGQAEVVQLLASYRCRLDVVSQVCAAPLPRRRARCRRRACVAVRDSRCCLRCAEWPHAAVHSRVAWLRRRRARAACVWRVNKQHQRGEWPSREAEGRTPRVRPVASRLALGVRRARALSSARV